MLICRTPVRISFVGGGTDFPVFYNHYGGEVISTTINKYFYTILTERDDNFFQIISSDFKIMETFDRFSVEDIKGDLQIPLAVIKYLRCAKGFNLFLASEVFPGTGLGSSGSVCVNLLKSIGTFMGKMFTKYSLAETAFYIATEVLNRPVGKQDEYASAFGGLNHISFEPSGVTVEPIHLSPLALANLERHILLFFTGVTRDSVEILSEQKKSSQEGEPEVIQSLKDLKSLAGLCKRALQREDLIAFGKVLNEAWKLKKRLSHKISNSHIDFLYQKAIEKGALGGKITGAGGGGFLMLFCEPDKQDSIRKAFIDEYGLREMKCKFEFSGATVIYDDPFLDIRGESGIKWKFVRTEA